MEEKRRIKITSSNLVITDKVFIGILQQIKDTEYYSRIKSSES